MLKKLAVPFLTLAIATFGCSSSTSNNGTGGSGGGAGTSAGGKGGGAAGSSAGGKGGGAAGSSAAGSGGGAAGSSAAGSGGGGKAGGGGSAAAGSGGGAAGTGNPDGSARSECTVTSSSGSDTLTPSIFCAQLEVNCPTQFATFANTAACEATYTSSGQEHCRSYHLCWGVEGITMEGGVGNPTVHCPHTIGKNNVCVAVTDAASGN